MKKKTNAFICIFLSLVMCIGLISCNGGPNILETQGGNTTQNNTETQSGNVLEKGTENQAGDTPQNEPSVVIQHYDINADYSLEYKDGGYVIIFDDPSVYDKNGQMSSYEQSYVDFSSVKEFKEAVTTGKLSDSQKRIVAKYFSKNAEGAVLTCDFSRLYVPTLPSSATRYDSVEWTGWEYDYSFSVGSGGSGFVSCMTEDLYNIRYQRDFVELFDRDTITVTDKKTVDNKEETNYKTTTGSFKKIRYTLSIKGKTIVVDKTFALQSKYPNSFSASSTAPRKIILYCNSNGQHYIVSLYDLQEDPTDEWLLEFGLEEFVDTESAEKLDTAN